MCKRLKIIGIVTLFCFCLIGIVVPSNAESVRLVYIDRDGDGIDDNARDYDDDGIPDTFQQRETVAADTPASAFLAELGSSAVSVPSLSPLEAYIQRDFHSRGLNECRSDFDGCFGSDVGVSASGGGGCAGGVCF